MLYPQLTLEMWAVLDTAVSASAAPSKSADNGKKISAWHSRSIEYT